MNPSENLGVEAVGLGNRFVIYVVLMNKEKSRCLVVILPLKRLL